MTDLRVEAHSGQVTEIFELHGQRMLTLDEHAKRLFFCGVGMARESEESLNSTIVKDRPGG
jgi:hypothetical protein